MSKWIQDLLGREAGSLLEHRCATIPRDSLHLPGPDFLDRVFLPSDRSPRVLRNLARIFDHGRLGGTGYVSILPVDQGIEHSAGRELRAQPDLLRPAKTIVELAIEGGCNAVASTLRRARRGSRRYAHKIPFIVKLNHNELLTYPNQYRPDHVRERAAGLEHGRGRRRRDDLLRLATNPTRRSSRSPRPSRHAHELGMFTVLWCYLRNAAFKTTAVDYHLAADLTGQANHLGVTIEADIIKQKLPGEQRRLHRARRFGKTSKLVYCEAHERPSDRPVPLPGGQLLHGPRRADQQRRRLQRARATWPRPCRPR